MLARLSKENLLTQKIAEQNLNKKSEALYEMSVPFGATNEEVKICLILIQ